MTIFVQNDERHSLGVTNCVTNKGSTPVFGVVQFPFETFNQYHTNTHLFKPYTLLGEWGILDMDFWRGYPSD